MKKVGIITVHCLPNWGSVLQAYALQKVIGRLGFEVENIDYRFPNEFHWKRGKKWGMNPPLTLRKMHRSIKNTAMYVLNLKARPLMHLLDLFIKNNMKLSKRYISYNELHKNPPIYDIYVSGSDQIWNPNTMLGDYSYMFDFTPAGAKIISYASSFSCRNIPEYMKPQYQRLLSRYASISVRENNGKLIIHELLGRDAKVVLDPSLLLEGNEWRQLSMNRRKCILPPKYILCYMLAYTFSADEPMNILLTRVQEKFKWPVIMLKNSPRDFTGEQFVLPKNYGVGIPEFLYLIQNASIVVSSSFHGTAFALNMGIPLVALAKENEDDRIASLVNNIGLANDILVMESEVKSKHFSPFYDVDKEQDRLNSLRKMSLDYLVENLQN